MLQALILLAGVFALFCWIDAAIARAARDRQAKRFAATMRQAQEPAWWRYAAARLERNRK